ncbi:MULTISPECIES: succinate dehydrogenase cytochrome b558 subunit [Alicyclobacillus]|uniref:Succinate dehydrogenase / fumarate reductase cytochrome b subunit n=1 Tax=Alicyclobacillus macrosporangiidus TaxID=392015 RepID=A0A1I7JAS4_9BACL|nr:MULTISPECIES: succinate dehydrogenase cytochrome b558 subunit [Alicyclobacillus]MCL6516579.1 succinate dehydrogenase cytochrome b558 subunit [Alicyclobacillus sp.]SFU82275.1 succinate dehydrogenase / fumarate reductase cytochrome b subunit [Alicyclobacillus macrosporangiidus]
MAQAQSHSEFVLRRLHTLAGVVPVGLFLLEHLFTNAMATTGAASFNSAVDTIQHIPFLHFIEFFFIFLPLTYHGVYGLYVAFTSGYNAGQYSWGRNVLFVLQRVTGVITFVFIIYHLWTTRFSGRAPTFDMVHQLMSNPAYLWFMVIGVVAATFHFANGLWSFCIHWGITVGQRAQRVTAYVTMVIFVVLAAVGIEAIFAFTRAA